MGMIEQQMDEIRALKCKVNQLELDKKWLIDYLKDCYECSLSSGNEKPTKYWASQALEKYAPEVLESFTE
jgi:hypothetical protein